MKATGIASIDLTTSVTPTTHDVLTTVQSLSQDDHGSLVDTSVVETGKQSLHAACMYTCIRANDSIPQYTFVHVLFLHVHTVYLVL